MERILACFKPWNSFTVGCGIETFNGETFGVATKMKNQGDVCDHKSDGGDAEDGYGDVCEAAGSCMQRREIWQPAQPFWKAGQKCVGDI